MTQKACGGTGPPQANQFSLLRLFQFLPFFVGTLQRLGTAGKQIILMLEQDDVHRRLLVVCRNYCLSHPYISGVVPLTAVNPFE